MLPFERCLDALARVEEEKGCGKENVYKQKHTYHQGHDDSSCRIRKCHPPRSQTVPHDRNEKDEKDQATFAGDYEAKFYYPPEVTEEAVTPLMEDTDYQYVLVAQAYPLAMTHFRRELQAMGLDARQLPLGLQ